MLKNRTKKFLGLLFLSACVSSCVHSGTPTAHKLTWRDYNGMDDPRQAIYILDGKVVGKGTKGLAVLRKQKFQRNSSIMVVHPWVTGPSSPNRLPPYNCKVTEQSDGIITISYDPEVDIVRYWTNLGYRVQITEQKDVALPVESN